MQFVMSSNIFQNTRTSYAYEIDSNYNKMILIELDDKVH